MERKIFVGLACQYCKRKYQGIILHERECLDNPGAPRLVCQHCHEPKWTSESKLTEHEKSCKDNPRRGENMFVCKHCHEPKATQKSDLARHEAVCKDNLRRDEETPKLICQHCHEPKGKQKAYLITHEKKCKKNPANKKGQGLDGPSTT